MVFVYVIRPLGYVTNSFQKLSWLVIWIYVTGVRNPNNQYNISWTKYGRLSNDLFLSSSYPKTKPLAP